MENKACNFCGSTRFEERRVEYIYRRKGDYLIVRDVPCEVCLHCGERYYPASVLLDIERRFEAIHQHRDQPQQTIQVPIIMYT